MPGGLTAVRAALSLERVSYRYGTKTVLDKISIQVAAGEIACLLGASGSGKSTLLRIVAGLLPLQEGVVRLDGLFIARTGHEPPPEERQCGFVFQDHVLFPHLTVEANVAFGIQQQPASQRKKRVLAQLRDVGLTGYAHRYPHTLSGGEQQRVALARALAPNPGVVLLDEPFGSVDSTLRRRMRDETRQALHANGAPTLIVTHDAEEAIELADRILILQNGRIVQDDVPEVVWQQPANRYVAELLNGSDAITGEVTTTGIKTAFGTIDCVASLDEGQLCSVLVRPESIHLEASTESKAHVADLRYLGDRYVAIVEVNGERLRAKLARGMRFEVGTLVSVAFDIQGVNVYAINDNDSH